MHKASATLITHPNFADGEYFRLMRFEELSRARERSKWQRVPQAATRSLTYRTTSALAGLRKIFLNKQYLMGNIYWSHWRWYLVYCEPSRVLFSGQRELPSYTGTVAPRQENWIESGPKTPDKLSQIRPNTFSPPWPSNWETQQLDPLLPWHVNLWCTHKVYTLCRSTRPNRLRLPVPGRTISSIKPGLHTEVAVDWYNLGWGAPKGWACIFLVEDFENVGSSPFLPSLQ